MVRLALVSTAALALMAVLASAPSVVADTLLLDVASEQREGQSLPTRGMSMERVEATFGEPVTKHRAVGDPPITRWEYRSFIVYFEYSHVIHTVMKRPSASR